MKTLRRIMLATITSSAIGSAVYVSADAAPSHATTMKALVVKVTTASGTVWGTVHVKYLLSGKTHSLMNCHRTQCTYHVPAPAKLHLTQVPFNSGTWPFKKWTMTSSGMTSSRTTANLIFKITGQKAIVKAVYVLSSSWR